MIKTLHIHAAERPHDEAYIVGSLDALETLYAAIGRTIASGRPEFARSFTADGEGFVAVVIPDEDMADAAVPYAESVNERGRYPRLSTEDIGRMRLARRG